MAAMARGAETRPEAPLPEVTEYHQAMTELQAPSSQPPEETEDSTRFDRFVRALFRVDRRDVPKHEPVKRAANQPEPNKPTTQNRPVRG